MFSVLLTLLSIVFCIFILYHLSNIIYSHLQLRNVIDKIPGPPAVLIFGNVLQWKFRRIDFAYQMLGFLYSYGSKGLYRMWVGHVPLVVLTKAHTAEAILSSNKLIEKSSNYKFLKNWIGDGLLISGGEKWRYRRKMLTPTFHFSILSSFVEVYCNQSRILIEQLKPFVERDLPFNIYPYIGRCALDIICETAMGVHVNAQKNHKSDYVQAVVRMCEILFKYERMPWLWVKPIFIAVYGNEYNRCMSTLRHFVHKVIRERVEERNKFENDLCLPQEGSRKRLAFLDLLLNMQHEHRLTNEDIREEVDTFMFEGHDTTSSSMSWTIYLLGQHQDVQKKVYEELETIFGNDKRDPTEDDLKEMKYLECVIKEALRLYTPVPLFARKTSEDFETGGYHIPSGTDVFVVPFVIHRDITVWGDHVNEFNPERFMPEQSTGRHPYSYVPFSAGSRNCIGQKFALMEEKVVISAILRQFHVQSLDPRTHDMMPIPDIILRPANGINVRLTSRD